MAPRFYFRDDVEAEKDRKAQAEQAAIAAPPVTDETALPTAGAPTTQQASQATQGAANAANAAFGTAAPVPAPTAPAAPTDYFADFRASLAEQDPLRAKLKASGEAQIDKAGQAFDVGANAARDKLGREIAVAGEQTRQEAATTFGGDRSGQMGRTMGSFRNETLLAQQGQEQDLAVGRADAVRGDVQAGQQALQGVLSSLDSQSRILADFALSQADQSFQEKMQEKGFVNSKDLAQMQADLQKELQSKGFDQQTSMQIADQQFQKAMQDRDQSYNTNLENLRQTFQRGERIDTQDFTKSMQASEAAANESMAKLQSLLQLNNQEQAQQFQTTFQTMQNSFTQLRDQYGMDHEMAMQVAANQFAKELQDQGFDHDTAIQAAQLAAQSQENQLSRASQEMMAATQLAQQDSQFRDQLMQEYGIKQQELDLNNRQLEGQLKLMGLQGDQLKQAMTDSRVQSALQMVSLGMEIGNGSAESMEPFVQLFGSSMEAWAKENGVDFDTNAFINSQSGGNGGGSFSGTGGSDTVATTNSLDSGLNYISSNIGTMPATVNKNLTKIESDLTNYAADGTAKPYDVIKALGDLPGFKGNIVGQSPNQAMYDYYVVNKLVKTYGMPEKDAMEVMGRMVGADRIKASYKALTGKDWGGSANVGAAAGAGIVGA